MLGLLLKWLCSYTLTGNLLGNSAVFRVDEMCQFLGGMCFFFLNSRRDLHNFFKDRHSPPWSQWRVVLMGILPGPSLLISWWRGTLFHSLSSTLFSLSLLCSCSLCARWLCIVMIPEASLSDVETNELSAHSWLPKWEVEIECRSGFFFFFSMRIRRFQTDARCCLSIHLTL